MKKFRYVGNKRNLIGHTALGRYDAQLRFKVQVDNLSHRFAFGWWQQNPSNWEEILFSQNPLDSQTDQDKLQSHPSRKHNVR